jgi:hypothetical protein
VAQPRCAALSLLATPACRASPLAEPILHLLLPRCTYLPARCGVAGPMLRPSCSLPLPLPRGLWGAGEGSPLRVVNPVEASSISQQGGAANFTMTIDANTSHPMWRDAPLVGPPAHRQILLVQPHCPRAMDHAAYRRVGWVGLDIALTASRRCQAGHQC